MLKQVKHEHLEGLTKAHTFKLASNSSAAESSRGSNLGKIGVHVSGVKHQNQCTTMP